MKLFSAIAAAALIGSSLIAATPAEASLYVDLNRKKATITKDGDARVTMNGPRGKFTLSQSDSLKAWKGAMDWTAQQNGGSNLTQIQLIQSLGGSPLKGPMGTQDVSDMDSEYLEAFAALYHYMKNTRGY